MAESGQGTVLVTGGASGIGFAVVEALLRAGRRTVVADLDQDSLERCRDSLAHSAELLRFERLNVAEEEAVIDTVSRCEAEFGPLAGVVNSAGIGRDLPALETDGAYFRQILEVNLVGSFLVAREAARVIKARNMKAGGGGSEGGSIVNLSSVSGLVGNPGRAAYGASKGGVIALTKVLAVEFAPLGIRVNAIAPGPIDTPLVSRMHSEAARALWTGATPQGRYGAPGDVASLALFLLDQEKSGYLTGQCIAVDGGFSIAGIIGDS